MVEDPEIIDDLPPNIVRIKGGEYELELPPSWARRQAALHIAAQGIPQACGAALGLCSGRIRRQLQIDVDMMQRDLYLFGETVFDRMIQKGCKPAEVQIAGLKALKLIREALEALSEARVEEERGNSRGPSI